ncbi:MAG: protein-L-isoaspartate O-methyltransferase [Proteobacteria bacterium]|nr:protein-L-isoaspartate O-methyltransferase [Pseudomonadota bacterium]
MSDPAALAELIEAEGVSDERVLAAIRATPRHLFVPELHEDYAYEDEAIAIGHGQSASQPYILARILELASVRPGERVLEIGAGSGYLTALLVHLGADVCAVELSAPLARQAADVLEDLELKADLRQADGQYGWPEGGPFDCIVAGVACANPPPAWLEQLADDGRIVAPVGRVHQRLTTLQRQGPHLDTRVDLPVSFATMTS